MGEVVDFPIAGPVPEPTGDAYLDAVELCIIRSMVNRIQHGASMEYARGLAESRAMYLRRNPELGGGESDPGKYLSTVVIALSRLSTRQQAKIKHPSRDRREVQKLISGESL